MNINTSPDISVLLIQPTFDISGVNPVVSITNLCEGPDLSILTTWFTLYSPTGTPIHEGSEDNPDITGSWTAFSLTDSWPRPFNQLEWSGSSYSLTVYVKDSEGNIFNSDPYQATICRPSGNTPTSKTFYGTSKTEVIVKCQQARISFQDLTNHTYRGLDGTQVTSVLRVVFPIDETGNIPTPFVLNNFSFALVPISYSSDNYQFQSYSVYDYDFGNYVHIRIRYQTLSKNQASYQTFSVLCNIDLGVLACEYAKLVDSLENGSCTDVQETQRKLLLINPKFAMAQMGIMQPLTGIDVPSLIEDIQRIGGFECDCCNVPTGIIPNTSSVIDGYSFSVVSTGGDIGGDVTTSGTNIQFNLHDKSYIFKMCTDVPTEAFTVTPSVSGDGFTKTYCLNVDLTILATDLLNTIKDNGTLVNLFNSIVVQGGSIELMVDGGCIFQSTSAFDYTFDLSNIPLNTTYAILTGITKSAVVQSLFYSFNITNISGLQTYLNSLGIGSFTVTNPSGQNVHIVSNANTNSFTALTYKISSTTYIATQSSTAAGYVSVSANYVVQQIINKICGLTDADIDTSQDYTICYIDPDTKQKTEITVEAGSSLATFISSLLTQGCKTVDYITSLGAVTCASIQNIFPASVNLMVATDYVLGTKAGVCARIGAVELGTRQLLLGAFDQDFVNAFCALVEQCGSGLPCAPYTLFQISLVDFDSSCPIISDFSYRNSIDGSSILITNIIFGNTPSSAQNITVEYKLQSDSSFTLYSASISIATDGTPLSTIDIPTSPGQTYNIRLSNNCSSPVIYFNKSITTTGSPSNNLNVINDQVDAIIDQVGFGGFGSGDFVLAGPINPGGNVEAPHPAFNGIIQVQLSGTQSGVGVLRLLVNSTNVDCVDATTAGVYSFDTMNYLVTDNIQIILTDDGPC